MPATGNTGAEVDQQKMALLTAIAQQGSQGQQAFQAEAARRAAAQQAAVASIAGQSKMTGAASNAPKAFTQQLQAKNADLGSVYAQDAAMSQNAFNNSIAQTSTSNAAYMDQAKAAVPVVQAQTAGLVAQIRAEQEAAAAERQFQLEQRRIEAEQAALDRTESQKERDLRQWEREQELIAGQEDKQLEKDDERLTSLLNRADTSAHPAVTAALAQIDKNGMTFEEAVKAANVYINRQIDPDTGTIEGFKGKDRLDLFRYVYEYYTGEKAPTEANKLGDAIAKAGGDPNKVPGYVPEDDRKKNYNPARTRRNPGTPGPDDRTRAAIARLAELTGGGIRRGPIPRTGIPGGN